MTAGDFTGSLQVLEKGPNARFYVSKLGRFAQPDNLLPNYADPESMNRYSYTYNNPVSNNDPTGHLPQCMDDFGCQNVANDPNIGISPPREIVDPFTEERLIEATYNGETAEDVLLDEWEDPLGGDDLDGGRFGESRGCLTEIEDGPCIEDLFCTVPQKDGSCNRYHMSVDIGDGGLADGVQIYIYAGAYGEVVFINYDPTRDLGVYIIVEHDVFGEKYYSVYGHLEEGSVVVSLGDTVDNSVWMANMGKTGTDNKHLHVEIRTEDNVDFTRQNPLGGQRYWGYDTNYTKYFVNLGEIYGYDQDYASIPNTND